MNSLRHRIMVVDDDRVFSRIVRLSLERTGQYEVREVNQAPHALDEAEEFLPHVILLDVMMPGLDGGEVAKRIEASRKLPKIPIVFLTAALSENEVPQDGMERGGYWFLRKPVSLRRLVQCLESHVAAVPA